MSLAKLTKLQAQARVLAVEAAQHKRWVSKQTLASFAGYVVSLSIAMPLARFHLLPIYDSLNTNSGWGYGVQVRLTTGAYRKLKFYFSSIPTCDLGCSIEPEHPSEALFTDASDVAWGGHLEHHDKVVSDLWSTSWATEHINNKELKAVHLSLQLLA